MNFEYKHLLNEDFDPAAKVWVYQSIRLFTISEALQVEEMIDQFSHNWNSHGVPVKAATHLFFGQFVVLMADETATGVSGCSTDSSVRLIKEIEKVFGANMFDRLALAFIVKDKVQILPMPQLKYAVEQGFITADTLFFNNVVLTKEELGNNWIIPAKDSWLAKKISFPNTVS